MAYNPRYIFNFASDNGTDYRIVISQRDYSGSAVQRALGRTPILKRETGEGGICGTSLEIYAECAVDGEFADLYTSDATEFHVALQVPGDSSYTTVWDGFVSPELYSEPDIAPPYDVQIIATDGLGELKLSEFVPAGRNTIWYYLKQILTLAGFNDTVAISESDYILVSSLKVTTPQVTPANLFTGLQIDPEHLSDKTNYEALESILGTFHMRVCRYMGKWVFWRETDTDIQSAVIPAAHGSSLPSVAYGSMATHTWWPVGNTSTEIVPAKRKTVAKLPYHRRDSMFDNPHLKDNTGWNTDGMVAWVDWGAGESRPMLAPLASISQAISVEASASDLVLRILTGSANTEGSSETLSYAGRWKMQIHGSVDRWLLQTSEGAEWVEEETYNPFVHTIVQVDSPTDWSVENFDAIEVTLPPIPVGGTLTITVDNALARLSIYIFAVGGLFLQQSEVPGYKDTVNISNGARGDDSEAEMAFGDAPDTTNIFRNFSNIITAGSSTPTSMWAKGSGTSMALVRLIALDHALSVALPRLRTKGKLNIPAGSLPPFALVSPEGLTLIPESWSWRIVDDELDFEATSVPATSLTVQSETMTEMTPSEAASSTGGSAASGGHASGGSYVDRYFTDQIEDDQVVGAKALRDLYITQEEADPQRGTPEVTKNITEILRHLALQVIEEGTEQEETILVTDLTLASTKNLIAGGIVGGSEPGGGGSLATLADVALGTLAVGDILQYNATTSHWVNVQPSLALLTDVALGTPTDGQALIWDATLGKWRPGTVASTGGIASVGLTMPTGFVVAGSPLTSDGTLQVSFASGYALPTTADVANGATAYGWGNHANAGYLTTATADGRYAAGFNYSSGKLYLVDKNGSVLTNISGGNLATAIGTAAVNRATNDANGNTIASQSWVTARGYLTSVEFGDLTSHPTTLAGYGITDAKISGGTITLGGNTITPLASVAFADLTSHPTTLSGYGITDAKISGGTITLGANTLTPLTDVSVVSGDNTIGTSLTTIGQVHGVNIRAKIAAYLLAADFTASNIVSTLGTTAVNRATADASGNTITSSYLRKDTDDTMSANLTIGQQNLSGSKTLTIYGRNNDTTPALTIYGVASATTRYATKLYRDSTALHIDSSVSITGNIIATGYIDSGLSPSDRRLKKDIKTMGFAEATHVLAALRPVTFAWNEKASELGQFAGDSRGFIADEYNCIIGNATRKMWGEYDAIDYHQVIPYLVAGWQLQQRRIEALAGGIEKLRRRLGDGI